MDFRLPCCLLVILSCAAANGKSICTSKMNLLEGEKIPTKEKGKTEVKNAGKIDLNSTVNVSEAPDLWNFNFSSAEIKVLCVNRGKRYATDETTRSASVGDPSVEDSNQGGFIASRGKRSAESEPEYEDEAIECIPTRAKSISQADALKRLGISPDSADDYFLGEFVIDWDQTNRNFKVRALNESYAARQFFGLRGKRSIELEDETEEKHLPEKEDRYIPTRRKRSAIKNEVEDDSYFVEANRVLSLFPDVASWPSWVAGPDKIRIKRIAGGRDAAEKEFPYQVSLRFEGLHICGGALISDRHILTAAHCICGMIDEPYKELTAVTGSVTIKNGGQTHLVKDVHCHHDFEYGATHSWIDDIAVITLNQTVAFNSAQSPVKLPTSNTNSQQAVLTGWGRSKSNGYLHNNLQKLTLKLLSNDQCQSYYNNTVLPSQICSFNGKGSGACKGDSGSPLVVNDTIIGIFSWTKPCAIGSPEVFTRVYNFLDFIVSSMKDEVGFKYAEGGR